MYTKASSTCGTGSVNVTAVNDTMWTILTPLNLAGFCKDVLSDITAEKLCSDCYMKTVQLGFSEPLEADDGWTPDDFNSLKQSCGIPTSSYPVKPTSPVGTPGPTPTCTTKATAKAGDTANALAKSLSVSTDRLLTYNNLPLSMNETFKGGEVLCLDNVAKCVLRQVVVGDTCSSLIKASGSGVDSLMFTSWNPTIGHDCLNLASMAGKYICISPPGSTTLFTPIGGEPTPPATTSKAPESTYSWGSVPNSVSSSMNFTTSWLFPTDGVSIPTLTATAQPPESVTAIAARISNCPFLKEDDPSWDAGLADDEVHLHSWDLSDECLESWDPYCNPDPTAAILPSPTNIASSCYPTVSTIIPDGWVAPPAPTSTGTPNNCNKWHVVGPGDTCNGVEAKYKISDSLFRQWNPTINAQCGNLGTGMAYCVRVWIEPSTTISSMPITSTMKPSSVSSAGPPGPTQSGTSPTCTKWHVYKQGDTCESIATQYGIIVSRFRQLNRGVDSQCSNLVLGNAYCVG
ncbi:uncharacterized protein BDR25DRAFT_323452 [Lindgomyces ingoldianus]|uniref:Uncharacterized protein n=1 Tax=Lindgomyces ingoldianus TaxID=673940 RepID=A0ACB6R3M8_9PLEO|nr:uncharacterized protein BDR25DRAFT_323452 [Lindgomyces ingoldianus]KAF2473700.1 hypothetical protein BDR25DRAFT_323452 [Lindgomyces ingoldianus]